MYRVPLALMTASQTHPAHLSARLTVGEVAGYCCIHHPPFVGDSLDIADILSGDMLFEDIQPRPADRLILSTQPARMISTLALPVGDVSVRLWLAQEQALGQLRIAPRLTVAVVAEQVLAHYGVSGQWQMLFARVLSPRTTLDQLPPDSILYGPFSVRA